MFPLMLTALNRDYSRRYYNPYEGLLVYGDHPNLKGLKGAHRGLADLDGVALKPQGLKFSHTMIRDVVS